MIFEGEKIKSFANSFIASSSPAVDSLSDPIVSRKLSKWFTARSFKEANLRQVDSFGSSTWSGKTSDGKVNTSATENIGDTSNSCSNVEPITSPVERIEIFDCIVYDSLFHVDSNSEQVARNMQTVNGEREFFTNILQSESINIAPNAHFLGSSSLPPTLSNGSSNPASRVFSAGKDPKNVTNLSSSTSKTASLIFDGEFECGNLERAIRVIGREHMMTPKATENLHDYIKPDDVHQEYDLILRNDLYTEGNIQWYYFSVKTPTAESIAEKRISVAAITYPLKVRFNIINMQKKDSLYNYGMRPVTYSVNQLQKEDWRHRGEDICYYRNGSTVIRKGKKTGFRFFYTLTFTYTFEQPDTVFFAHSYPYTYSDLKRYLRTLELNTTLCNRFHRAILCETLAGNRCDILTITEKSDSIVERQNKPSIVITSRIHPGESNSSYMVHGLIDFLLSDSAEAFKLRKSFIFTIVPMLNPDGVIHGNYRCSLAGTDLNRRFAADDPGLYPTISALKNRIKAIQKNRRVLLYLDLHGHSKQKNSFLYGCDITLQPPKAFRSASAHMREDEIVLQRIHSRIFPHILCTISNSSRSGYFSFSDCSFKLHQSKMGTGRAVLWKELGIEGSYTIEASFCGNGNNKESKLFKRFLPSNPNNNIGATNTTASTADNNNNEKDNGNIPTSGQSFRKGDYSSGSALVSDILKQYKDAYHYRKHDLLNMGKDICLAIYHFSNLSHSDLNRELQLAIQADTAAKVLSNRKAGGVLTTNSSPQETERKQPQQKFNLRLEHKTRNKKDNLGRSSQLSAKTVRVKNTATVRKNVTVFSNEESSDNDDLDDEESICERESSAYNDDDGEAEAAGVDAELERNHSSHSSSSSQSQSNTNSNSSAGWKGTGKILLIDKSMKNRSILTHSVFASQHLHQMLMAFPSEAAEIKPSENLGMRVKSELFIRRLLKCDVTSPIFENLPLPPLQDDIDVSEDEKSANGSESDPSVDNNLAPKLFKKIEAKSGDSKALIDALRVALKKKHKREEQKQDKIPVDSKPARERCLPPSVPKYLGMAHSKSAAEIAAATALYSTSAHTPSLSATGSSANISERSSRSESAISKRFNFRRKSATASKYAPAYLLEDRSYQVPCKLVNFGEFDGVKDADSPPPEQPALPAPEPQKNIYLDEFTKIFGNAKITTSQGNRLSSMLFDDYEAKFGGVSHSYGSFLRVGSSNIPSGNKGLAALYSGGAGRSSLAPAPTTSGVDISEDAGQYKVTQLQQSGRSSADIATWRAERASEKNRRSYTIAGKMDGTS